jgi:hypothetical protein
MRRSRVLSIAFASVVAGACHHDPPPAPPMPPEPRTPVGYLLEDASELQLSVDEVSQLKQIDAALAVQLAAIDPQIDAAVKAQAKAADSASSVPAGGGGGGMRGGGMRGGGGGMGGGGGGGRRGRGGGGGGGSATHANASMSTVDRLSVQRADAVRTMLLRAIAALDPKQQVIAKQRLSDHDVDLDDENAESNRNNGNRSGSGDGSGNGDGNGNGNGNGDGNGTAPEAGGG